MTSWPLPTKCQGLSLCPAWSCYDNQKCFHIHMSTESQNHFTPFLFSWWLCTVQFKFLFLVVSAVAFSWKGTSFCLEVSDLSVVPLHLPMNCSLWSCLPILVVVHWCGLLSLVSEGEKVLPIRNLISACSVFKTFKSHSLFFYRVWYRVNLAAVGICRTPECSWWILGQSIVFYFLATFWFGLISLIYSPSCSVFCGVGIQRF